IVGYFWLGVADIVLVEVLAEFVHHVVVDFEAVRDAGLGAEVVAREVANALLGGNKHRVAEKRFLEFVELRRVNNDIRRDAAAASNLAAAIGLANLRRVIGHFAFVVIFVEGHGLVVALNQAAGRRVVTCSRECQAGVFRKRRDGLDEALAELGFANNQAAVMVLHRAGNDFGGGGGVIVHKNYERHGHALIAADGDEAALRGIASVIRDDELALVEEHVADSDGFIEEAARIAAHIQNNAIERIRAKLLQSVGDFAVGSLVELRELDVADAGLHQESDVDGVPRNLVARDSKHQRIGIAFTGNRNLHDGALGAFQHVGDFRGGQAVGHFVIDLGDDVSWTQPRVVGRRSDVRRDHDGAIVAGSHDHANAIVFAALIFAQERELALIKEIRVGIEHTKHAGDSALVHGLVHIDRLGIVALDHIQNFGEIADGGLRVVSGRTGGSHGRSIDAAKDGRNGQDGDNY